MKTREIITNISHIVSWFFYVLVLYLLYSTWSEMMIIINSMSKLLASYRSFRSKRNRKSLHPLSFNSLSCLTASCFEKTSTSFIWIRNAPKILFLMSRHGFFMATHGSANLLLSNIWNLSCNNIPQNVRTSGLFSIKAVNYLETPMSEISSSNTSMKFSLLVMIPLPKMVLLNELTVLSPMVSKVAWLILASPLHTSPLLFFMSYKFETHFLETVKAFLLLIFQLERKTTSRISVLLAVEFGSALQESKQRGSKIKFKKGIFLSYVPHITQNIIWYDVESQRCKIAVHCVFGEEFNNVPIESLCPNAQPLLHVANGNDLTEIKGSIDDASDLEFYIYPFSEKQTTVVHVSPTEDNPTFGFEMKTDKLHKRVYISNASAKSTASSIYKSKKASEIIFKVRCSLI